MRDPWAGRWPASALGNTRLALHGPVRFDAIAIGISFAESDGMLEKDAPFIALDPDKLLQAWGGADEADGRPVKMRLTQADSQHPECPIKGESAAITNMGLRLLGFSGQETRDDRWVRITPRGGGKSYDVPVADAAHVADGYGRAWADRSQARIDWIKPGFDRRLPDLAQVQRIPRPR